MFSGRPTAPPIVINDRSVTEVKLDGLNANNKNPRRKSVPCGPRACANAAAAR